MSSHVSKLVDVENVPTVNQGTSPWVVTGTVTTTPPAHASTNVDEIGGAPLTEGQKLSADSIPVVIASDQSAVPISGTIAVSNFPATQPVSAVSLPLPTGSATSANQTNGTQQTQVTNFPATQPVSGTVTATPPALPSSAVVGQSNIAVTGTAVQLSSGTLVNGVVVSASLSNAASITIGGSGVNNTVNGTGNGYILQPGASVGIAINNTNVLYINGTAGDVVAFVGS